MYVPYGNYEFNYAKHINSIPLFRILEFMQFYNRRKETLFRRLSLG